MELDKFLSLCSMLLGAAAVAFLSKVLLSSADEILRGMVHYSPIAWPSVEIISDKASQKSDTLASIILVSFALLFQIITIFLGQEISFTKTTKNALIVCAALTFVIIVVVRQVNVGFKAKFEKDIKTLAARNYVESNFKIRKCPLYRDIQAIARQYFDIKKDEGENDQDFVKRFAAYLKYEIPEDADFSRFK